MTASLRNAAQYGNLLAVRRDWARLAVYAENRRQAMGARPRMLIVNPGTWRKLQSHRAPGPDPGPLSDASLRRIEDGLGWEIFSADAVLAGGEPTLKPEPGGPEPGGPAVDAVRCEEPARHLDDRPDDVVAAVYVTADFRAVVAFAGDTEEDRKQIRAILARGRRRGLEGQNHQHRQHPGNA